MPQKILIYGEDWLGTLPNLLKTDLIEKGYLAKVFDWTQIMPGIRSRNFISRVKRKVFFNYYNKKIENAFYLFVNDFKPDIIIISKGLNLSAKFIEGLKKTGIPIHNWNPDDFFNMKNSSLKLLQAIPLFDSIITARKHLSDDYKSIGAKKIIYAEWYYVPNLHFRRNAKIQREISFVGSWSKSREDFIEGINIPVDIWGSGWKKAKKNIGKRHNLHNTVLSQKEMSAVFNSSRYNLNLLTHENNDFSNLRIFEVTASGGLLMTPRNSFSESLFEKEEGCFLFNCVNEVNRFIQAKDLINNDKLRLAGYNTIKNGKHTFSDRVDQVMYELLK